MKLLMKTKLHEKGNSSNDLKKKKNTGPTGAQTLISQAKVFFCFLNIPKLLFKCSSSLSCKVL